VATTDPPACCVKFNPTLSRCVSLPRSSCSFLRRLFSIEGSPFPLFNSFFPILLHSQVPFDAFIRGPPSLYGIVMCSAHSPFLTQLKGKHLPPVYPSFNRGMNLFWLKVCFYCPCWTTSEFTQAKPFLRRVSLSSPLPSFSPPFIFPLLVL